LNVSNTELNTVIMQPDTNITPPTIGLVHCISKLKQVEPSWKHITVSYRTELFTGTSKSAAAG